MNIDIKDWKKGIIAGLVAGVIWGWVALATNWVTGFFPLEESLLYELITFGIGGAVFGTVAAGFLVLTRQHLPFKHLLPKAVMLSTSLWLLLYFTGAWLSATDHDRYHPVMDETIQGLCLAVVMGGLIWLFWRRPVKAAQ